VTVAVINADTLAIAAQSGQNLWREAKECHYQVITLAPKNTQVIQIPGSLHVSLFPLLLTTHPSKATLHFLRIPSIPKKLHWHPSLLFLTLATLSMNPLLISKDT